MSAIQEVLCFGEFELNLTRKELRKNGGLVPLQPQPFCLLALLSSRAGEVVTRDEIKSCIWGNETYGDFDNGQNKSIRLIRAALGDRAEHSLYIKTITRTGYTFVAPVTHKTIDPQLSDRGYQLSCTGVGGQETDDATEQVPPAAPSRAAMSTLWARRTNAVWTAVAVAVVLSGAAAWTYYRSHSHKSLTEKDTLVVVNFQNNTREVVFDDTLQQALRLQLEQSPFLELIPETKINKTLKLMGRSSSDQLTPDMGRDLCQRVGSKALVEGSIAKLETEYVIATRAVDCGNGELIVEAQQQARDKDDVLKALDKAASKLRKKLGESLSSVQKYSVPLEEATTSSLDALKAYSVGRKIWFAEGVAAALPFYEWAVRLDPNFAMPYVALSIGHSTLGETGKAAEYAQMAYDLRGKVSERERLTIEATYYLDTTGQLDKAAEIYEIWHQTYPRDNIPYSSFPFIYGSLGQYDKALQEAQEILRLNPNNEANYNNVCAALINLNRFDEAEKIYKQAEQVGLRGEHLLSVRYSLDFLRGDTGMMEQVVAKSRGKAGLEHWLLATHADTNAWYGHFKDSRALTEEAMALAERSEARETAAAYKAAAALREAASGNKERARSDAYGAQKLAPTRDVLEMTGLALAMIGDTKGAQRVATKLADMFPLDTLVQRYWLPSINGAVALAERKPGRTLELLKITSPIELGMPTIVNVYLCPVYLRGQADLNVGDGRDAATEFQKFIDHRGLVGNFQWGILARLGLARAYALTARHDPMFRDKARLQYQDFLSAWRGADPDIPILQQAKTEYTKLPTSSGSFLVTSGPH